MKDRPLPLALRAVSALLLPALLFTSAPFMPSALAAEVFGPAPGLAPSAPTQSQPVPFIPKGPPRLVGHRSESRTNPAPPPTAFSARPQEREFALLRILPEPLLPIGGKPGAAENQALAGSLSQYQKSGTADRTEALENFLLAYPASSWRATLEANLGFLWRKAGYWTRALSILPRAWQDGQAAEEPTRRLIIDRAVAELAELLARLGRVEELATLIDGVGDRSLAGSANAKFADAKLSLSLMRTEPQRSFRCGPMALGRIWASLHPDKPFVQAIFDSKCTAQGTSLDELATLSGAIGLPMQPAQRAPGAEFLVPSVVHWKAGHFAALIKAYGQSYVVEDPTFGEEFVISRRALEEEASGYFLVPPGDLPEGWHPLEQPEAKTVWGKGAVVPSTPPPPPDQAPKLKGCQSLGMAGWDVDPSRINLLVSDVPLQYAPPRGPAITFSAHYSFRDATSSAVANHANLGDRWNLQLISYLVDDVSFVTVGESVYLPGQEPPQDPPPPPPPPIHVSCYGPGGGVLSFLLPRDNSNWSPSAPEPHSFATLVPAFVYPNTGYVLKLSDGTQRFYVRSGPTSNYCVLTKIVDPQGNMVTFQYDSSFRLTGVTDALSQSSSLTYVSDDPQATTAFFKVARITDPFGRYCAFAYNSTTGLLSQITDSAGIVSQFGYSGNFINQLTTPYGTTVFTETDSGNDRQLDITDPLGETERVLFKYSTDVIADAADPLPTGMNISSSYWGYRNTLYWDKKAFAEAPNDFLSAHLRHWLHTADGLAMSDVLESEKAPYESRIFYNYPSQGSPILVGSSNTPSSIGRVLADGSSQISQASYDPVTGALLATVTPGDANIPARATSFTRAANGLDVTAIDQALAGGFMAQDRLFSATYNAQHRPLTITDAAGQTATCAYNSFGQIKTVTNAQQQTLTFVYDRDDDNNGETDGYLLSVTGPVAGVSTSCQYDAFGRVSALGVSEFNGGTDVISLEYDAIGNVATSTLDRVTKVTYPDHTFQQMIFTALDAEWTRDRAGRWSHIFHDKLRRVAGFQDPLGRLTQFVWCGCGGLEALVDPAGNQTTFMRDLQGRVTDKVYPDNKTVHYAYETRSGRLHSVTDAKGQTATYVYNIDNTVASVAYSGSNIPTAGVSFGYDPRYGRLTQMIDGSGTTTYAYNPVTKPPTLGAGRLASIDGPLTNDTISYAYDELGRAVGRQIDGTANAAAVHYDTLARADSLTNPLGTFQVGFVGQTGRLASLAAPNGQTSTFSYWDSAPGSGTPPDGNRARRLKTIEHLGPPADGVPPLLSRFGYEYNVSGQISGWTQNQQPTAQGGTTPPAVVERFDLGYDASMRLTDATLSDATTGLSLRTFGYRYDYAGNRLTSQEDASAQQGAFNALNQQLTLASGNEFLVRGNTNKPASVQLALVDPQTGLAGTSQQATIESKNGNFTGRVPIQAGATNTIQVRAKDASGNETVKTFQVQVPAEGIGKEYAYDGNGNVMQVKENGAVTRTYEWDALDRLVGINYLPAGGRTEIAYDGFSRWVHLVEKDASNTVTAERRFVWEGFNLTEERNAAGAVVKRFFAEGEERPGAGPGGGSLKLYYTRDHLGSVREVSDAAGALRARYAYDLWGVRTKIAGDLTCDFGFTGHYEHDRSALTLAPFRAYDSSVSRWLSRDLLQEAGGLNLYAYAGSNPVNGIDTLGLAPVVPWGGPYLNSPVSLGGTAGARAVGGTAGGRAVGWLGPIGRAAAIGWALGELINTIPGVSDSVTDAFYYNIFWSPDQGGGGGANEPLPPEPSTDGAGARKGPPNWRSVKCFGHTFLRHGQNQTDNLIGRAAGRNADQGKWTNNEQAAEILNGLQLTEPTIITIPPGLGQVIRPDGTIVPTEHAMVIPKAGGAIRSAYPILP